MDTKSFPYKIDFECTIRFETYSQRVRDTEPIWAI